MRLRVGDLFLPGHVVRYAARALRLRVGCPRLPDVRYVFMLVAAVATARCTYVARTLHVRCTYVARNVARNVARSENPSETHILYDRKKT